MSEERLTTAEEAVLQQQYLRALDSFEETIHSHILIENQLGDRLNYSIQAGIIILGVIAVSILALLLTLSAQINNISAVVSAMNRHFTSVAERMHHIRGHMVNMEQGISLLAQIERMTGIMDSEMAAIDADLARVRQTLGGIDDHVDKVSTYVGRISVKMDIMNNEVRTMSWEIHQLATPARTMNKLFPFP